jgi:hypothetical protein
MNCKYKALYLYIFVVAEILCAEFEQRGIPSLNPFHEPFHAHATILFLTGEEDKDLVKYWPGEERKWHGRRLGTETVEG